MYVVIVIVGWFICRTVLDICIYVCTFTFYEYNYRVITVMRIFHARCLSHLTLVMSELEFNLYIINYLPSISPPPKYQLIYIHLYTNDFIKQCI